MNLSWPLQSPASRYENIFAILETFRLFERHPQSSEAIQNLCVKFHLYIVHQAFPIIAARILKGSRTWERHPMDTLAEYYVSNLRDRLPVSMIDIEISSWTYSKFASLSLKPFAASILTD